MNKYSLVNEEIKKKISQRVRLYVADIGSWGGLSDLFDGLGHCVYSYQFDPRLENDHIDERASYFKCGLSNRKENRKFYVANKETLSSFRKPNKDVLKKFKDRDGNSKVKSERVLQVNSFDDTLGESPVDYMKIDVQGFEDKVICGAGMSLKDKVLAADVEVSFIERYMGSPSVSKIIKMMDKVGFELIDFHNVHRYIKNNSFSIDKDKYVASYKPGQLSYCNALFVLKYCAIDERLNYLSECDKSQMIDKLIIIQFLYGKIDLGAAIYDRYKYLLDSDILLCWDEYFKKIESIRCSSMEDKF